MLDGGKSEVTGSAAVCTADLVYYAAEGERLVGLVKNRRLMVMHPPSPRLRRTGRQQRAIHLRQGYGGLKAGMKPPVKKGGGVAYLRKARGSGEMPESRHSVGIRPGG